MKLTVLVVTLLLTVPASANLLENGQFNNWSGIYPTGWWVEDSTLAKIEQDSGTVRSPAYSVKATRLVEGTGSNKGVKQMVPISSGQEYTLSAWCYDDDHNASGGIGITWRDADTAYISHSGTFYSDSAIHTWQRLSKTSTAPSTAAFADCLVRVYGFSGSPSGGIIYFDDAELVEGPGAVEEAPPTRGAFPGVRLNVSPNPAPGRTTLSFELSRPGRTRLDVFDLTGSRVRTLFSGNTEHRTGAVAWQGRTNHGTLLPDGLYFAVLTDSEGRTAVRKLVLQR